MDITKHKSYRPICISSVYQIVIEKCILPHLQVHLAKNTVLNQHGYMKQRSTETAVALLKMLMKSNQEALKKGVTVTGSLFPLVISSNIQCWKMIMRGKRLPVAMSPFSCVIGVAWGNCTFFHVQQKIMRPHLFAHLSRHSLVLPQLLLQLMHSVRRWGKKHLLQSPLSLYLLLSRAILAIPTYLPFYI